MSKSKRDATRDEERVRESERERERERESERGREREEDAVGTSTLAKGAERRGPC